MNVDQKLVSDELVRLVAIKFGEAGWERALVRRVCLCRLGATHAAAVLRFEAFVTLSGQGPWYGPGAPHHGWNTECNRMHYLAGAAGLTGYRLPEPHEMLQLVHSHRLQHIRDPYSPWW